MKKRELNPLEDLAELKLYETASKSEAGTWALHAELRFGETTQVDDTDSDFEVKFSIKRAFLDLDLVGLEVVPDTRFGDVLKTNEITVSHRDESKKTTSKRVAGELSTALSNTVSGASASGSLGAKGSVDCSQTTTSTSEIVQTISRIKPRAGDKWEFVDPLEEPLDGKYLAAKDELCQLKAKSGSNQKNVVARVRVHARDVLADFGKRGVWRSMFGPNREKVLRILASKTLNKYSVNPQKPYKGVLILSEAEVDDEE